MFREVLEFLSADGWPVAPDTFDGLPCIRTRFIGTDEAWDCRARPYDPFGQLAFESILPVVVEPAHRDAVAHLVVRANWRLLTGAFQLDVDTGELVFRTMVFLPDGVELSDALCRGLVYSNVLTVDRCLAEFMSVAAGGDALEAFERLAL
ncbi:MAG TPA: YbjN domain-containing protein [Acidimicrobiales bacterium]|nr:YbjN domain-containing protein [Acidimicrobiales bacterium]